MNKPKIPSGYTHKMAQGYQKHLQASERYRQRRRFIRGLKRLFGIKRSQ